MIKIEFQKLFQNVRFYFSILGIAAGILLSAMDLIRYDAYYKADDLFGSVTDSAFVLICFVLCIVGGGFSFCVEQKNHCIGYEILRCNVRAYSTSKVIVSFIGGYLTTFLGCVLGECSIGVIAWCHYRDWSKVFTSVDTIKLTICFVIVFALLCGSLSVLALLVTVIMPDFFVAMSMPILIYYMWLNVTGWIEEILPPWLDIAIIYQAVYTTYDAKVFMGDFVYALLFTLCLVFGMWNLVHKGMKWRLENG